MVVNIQTISRLVESNKAMRNVVEWFIKFTLQLLSAQRLIDDRKLQAASLDWERGTLSLGNSFSEQLVARSISKYVIDSHLDADRQTKSLIRKDAFDRARAANVDVKNLKF